MKLLVEAATGEELSVGGERNAVHRLLVPEWEKIVIYMDKVWAHIAIIKIVTARM